MLPMYTEQHRFVILKNKWLNYLKVTVQLPEKNHPNRDLPKLKLLVY